VPRTGYGPWNETVSCAIRSLRPCPKAVQDSHGPRRGGRVVRHVERYDRERGGKDAVPGAPSQGARTASITTSPAAESRDHSLGRIQRVLTVLGVSHLVAPSPQAKGKIERRFGTLQGRVVTLLGHEKVQSFAHAQLVLQAEIDPLNRTVCRTTRMSSNDRWDKALQDGMTVMQPAPCTALLDLHLALHYRRRRNTDNQVDFAGRSWAIAPTHRKTVGIIHHPDRQFCVVTEPPSPPQNQWPDVLGKYSL